jgi:multidrug efflux pump subunit AcrA (membrane-fusion protein)
MPVLEWSRPGVILSPLVDAVVLIAVSLLIRMQPSRRGKTVTRRMRLVGMAAATAALALLLIPSPPEWFDRAAEWYPCEYGDVVVTTIAAGEAVPSEVTPISVQVRASRPGVSVGAIRWVVDNDTAVRKGQLLVELEDSQWRRARKEQDKIVALTETLVREAEKGMASENATTTRAVEEAERQLAAANNDLNAYKGNDPLLQNRLRFCVHEAEQLVKTCVLERTSTQLHRQERCRIAQAMYERELTRRTYLHEQIAHCKIVAPRDGLAIYYVPERSWRRPGLPAAGQQVKEGQRLLSLFDPAQMLIRAQLHESQIGRVCLGQAAHVRIDAFPERTYFGRVSRLAPTTTRVNRISDVKELAVWVTPLDPAPELRPGMRAEVSIELGRHDNVLCVPLSALHYGNAETVCFVKSGRTLETRAVTVGLSDRQFVEISAGLKEGERVLREATKAGDPK